MITIEEIHVSPVKSLALSHPDAVDVSWQGITEDRRLFLVDDRGRLVTQRHFGSLVRVKAEYRQEPEWLVLHMPGGIVVEGPVSPGEATVTRIFGRRVMGNAAPGEWDGRSSPNSAARRCGSSERNSPVNVTTSFPSLCFPRPRWRDWASSRARTLPSTAGGSVRTSCFKGAVSPSGRFTG